MPKFVMIDAFHLSLWMPHGQPEATDAAVRATLDSRRFQGELRRALRDVVRNYLFLNSVRVRLTR